MAVQYSSSTSNPVLRLRFGKGRKRNAWPACFPRTRPQGNPSNAGLEFGEEEKVATTTAKPGKKLRINQVEPGAERSWCCKNWQTDFDFPAGQGTQFWQEAQRSENERLDDALRSGQQDTAATSIMNSESYGTYGAQVLDVLNLQERPPDYGLSKSASGISGQALRRGTPRCQSNKGI